MENAKYMDEEALQLFLLWGQTDEDRAEIAAALSGCPVAVAEPTRVERVRALEMAPVLSLADYRARRIAEAA